MSSMAAIWIPKRLVEVSLVNTAAASAQRFVSHCEIEYESRIFAAAGEISAAKARLKLMVVLSEHPEYATQRDKLEEIFDI